MIRGIGLGLPPKVDLGERLVSMERADDESSLAHLGRLASVAARDEGAVLDPPILTKLTNSALTKWVFGAVNHQGIGCIAGRRVIDEPVVSYPAPPEASASQFIFAEPSKITLLGHRAFKGADLVTAHRIERRIWLQKPLELEPSQREIVQKLASPQKIIASDLGLNKDFISRALINAREANDLSENEFITKAYVQGLIDLQDLPTRYAGQLTFEEKELLPYVFDTAKEIGEYLGISGDTVAGRFVGLYKKLGVRNRIQTRLVSLRDGYIASDS